MKRRGRIRAIIISVVVFAVISTAFVLFQIVSERHETQTIRLKARFEADLMTSRMQEYLDERVRFMEVIRGNIRSGHISNEEEFTQHVREAKKVLRGFQAINWIDSAGVIRWVCPLKGNEEAKDKDLRLHPSTSSVMARVDATGDDLATPPIDLLQGGLGFAMYFPIKKGGRNAGYLNGVFLTGPLLDKSIDGIIKAHYYYSVHDGGQAIITLKDDGDEFPGDNFFREEPSQPVRILNRSWRVLLTPKPKFLATMQTAVNEWITVIGVILAAVMSIGTYRFMENKESILIRKEELEAVYLAYPDLQFRVRCDGTILDYHTSRTTDLYVSPEEFLGKRMQDVLPAAVGVLFEETFNRVLKGEPNDSIEYALDLTNGQEFYEARVIPVSDDELIVIARNITPRKCLEESMRWLAEGVSSVVDDDFFDSLVHHLTIAAGVDYAFVGVLNELAESGACICTLANCRCGASIDNMEYELSGTPCERVILDQLCIRECGVARDFPNDTLLTDMGIDGYAGVPLIDSSGTTRGVLVMMHTGALLNVSFVLHLLRVFAIRCAGELERQRYEKKLLKSQDRLRTVIDNLPGVVYSYVRQRDGTRTSAYFSPGLDEIIGSESGHRKNWVESEDYLALMHPADRDRLEDLRKMRNPPHKTICIDFRVRTDRGSYHWLRSLGSSQVISDDCQRWNGIILDIDKEKRSELALARERQLFVGGPVVVFRWVAEKGWPVEYVTPNVEEVFGYSADDFMSRRVSYSEIIHADDFERVTFEVLAFTSSGHDSFGEMYRIIRPDGTVRSLYDYTVAERGEHGKVTHFAGYVFDITEQQEAREALAQSELRYRCVVEQAPIPIIINIDNAIIFANDAAVRCVAGSSPDDLIGMSIWSFVHPDDHEMVRKRVNALHEGLTDMVGTIEERFVRLDGAVIDVEVSGTRIIFDGRPALQVIFQDVTKRRQADRLMSIQNDALAAVATGCPRSEIFDDLCINIQRGMSGSFATIMLYDGESGYLKLISAPSASSEVLRAYDNIKPSLASGSCGTAAFTGKAVFATDVYTDSRWSPELCEVAKMVGIRSCWSHPIFSEQGTVLGTFALSHDHECIPEEFDERLLESAASLAGIVLQRDMINQSLRESEERYRTLVENAPEAIVVFDADTTRLVDMNENGCVLFKGDREALIGMALWEVSPEVQPNGQLTSDLAGKYIAEAMAGGTPVFEWLHRDLEGTIIPCEVRLVRLPSLARKFIRGSITDISRRKAAERRQQFMMDELDHRVKNNLASVLALTRQTVTSCNSLDEFSRVFTGRIEALARAHSALASSKWEGVSLHDMMRTILNPQFITTPGHISYEGDTFVLSARSSGPVAMTLHELMTNSLKHGSFSLPGGRLSVSWHIDNDSSLCLEWIESDGPIVSPPAHTGLGLKLVRGFIEFELDGRVELEFAPEGLTCRLTIPILEENHRGEAEMTSAAQV